MKVGFVILCYGKYDMVIDCIEKLQRLDGIEQCKIVLVDNCSPDNTGEIIKKRYAGVDNIHVILNDTNLGFAKGNNVGYDYASESCDTLVVMNSDVFIEQKDFIHKLYRTVESEGSAIIAPDIIGNLKGHINPYMTSGFRFTLAVKSLLINSIAIVLLKSGINYFRWRHKKADVKPKVEEKMHGIFPHGSCIIYTPLWTKNERQAFYPGTFLFCEEAFLFEYAKKKKYDILYTPELSVFHIGDASIDHDTANENRKRIFVYSNHNKSLIKYIKFLGNVEKYWTMG